MAEAFPDLGNWLAGNLGCFGLSNGIMDSNTSWDGPTIVNLSLQPGVFRSNHPLAIANVYQ